MESKDKKLSKKRSVNGRGKNGHIENGTPKKLQKLTKNGKSAVGPNTCCNFNNLPLAKKTRKGKPDFKPYYTEHRKIMERNGLKTEDMITLRRKIHQQAEGGFKEFKT